MEVIRQFRFIIVPIGIWFFIQAFKVVWDLAVTHKFNFKRILGAGGMPTSIATMIGKNDGVTSTTFALAVVFACVVMYDAAGVRRAAGKQAKLLNKILETPGLSNLQVHEKLVEVLGHTPKQVFVGAVIGIIVGLIVG